MPSQLIRFLLILLATGQGLVCLFSFFSLIFISYARRDYAEGITKEIIDNLIALAFTTYLFTFFNILFKNDFVVISKTAAELILNIYIVLILIVIIKTTVDIIKYSKKSKKNKR